MATDYIALSDASQAISNAFRILLSEKHIYQSVEVNVDFIDRQVAARRNPKMRLPNPPKSYLEELRKELLDQMRVPWDFAITGAKGHPEHIEFDLPVILTDCAVCKNRWPFSPVFQRPLFLNEGIQPAPTGEGSQRYTLFYQCPTCKGVPVVFLVRRKGLKLTICGRDPIERIITPSFLPSDKKITDHFASALLEYNTGQTLPAWCTRV